MALFSCRKLFSLRSVQYFLNLKLYCVLLSEPYRQLFEQQDLYKFIILQYINIYLALWYERSNVRLKCDWVLGTFKVSMKREVFMPRGFAPFSETMY